MRKYSPAGSAVTSVLPAMLIRGAVSRPLLLLLLLDFIGIRIRVPVYGVLEGPSARSAYHAWNSSQEG